MARMTPLPDWFREGIMFVGNWEPLMFRRRAGFAHVNEESIYEAEHSEESVHQLKEAGVNLVITHFHKGFGREAEREEIERTGALSSGLTVTGSRLGFISASMPSVMRPTLKRRRQPRRGCSGTLAAPCTPTPARTFAGWCVLTSRVSRPGRGAGPSRRRGPGRRPHPF